ncbi:low molecular weight phosphatase family protein [Paenibacillus sp. EC2-1]|uniref:arsenate-mycothiol transferase ArsC n=1 Tax=Paenibacillus sp. EC2-1 TaxID=3388665 RepID=UPI003BEEB2E4
MNIMFVCTDNFTRSVIAEFCMKDFLRRCNNTSIKVTSAGIQANNDISKYSNIHFKIMKELNIDTTGFTRTMFDGKFFNEYDVIIAMSDLHRTYIKEQYNRDVPLFNEIYKGQKTSVNIGPPDRKDFLEQMNKLVHFFYESTPLMIRNIEEFRTKTHPLIDSN